LVATLLALAKLCFNTCQDLYTKQVGALCLTWRPTSVVTRKLVNRRSVTISPSCKRLRPDLSGAEHARRSGRYGEMFQRGRKVKEGRRWLMNLGVTTLVSCSLAATVTDDPDHFDFFWRYMV